MKQLFASVKFWHHIWQKSTFMSHPVVIQKKATMSAETSTKVVIRRLRIVSYETTTVFHDFHSHSKSG